MALGRCQLPLILCLWTSRPWGGARGWGRRSPRAAHVCWRRPKCLSGDASGSGVAPPVLLVSVDAASSPRLSRWPGGWWVLAGLLTFPYALLLLPGEMPGGVWQGGHVSRTLLSSCCLAPEVGRGTCVPQAGRVLSPGQDPCPAGVRLPGSRGARGAGLPSSPSLGANCSTNMH